MADYAAQRLSLPMLGQVAAFVLEKTGLHFPKERYADLSRILSATALELGFESEASYIRKLFSSPGTHERLDVFINHLTVGETYFYRDHGLLEFFQEQIVPELFRIRQKQDRNMLLWSAGCSSGEEPYSLAMILDRIKGGVAGFEVKIKATDINKVSLQKATSGRYGKWSFRDTPDWLKRYYFKKDDDSKYQINQSIKEAVTFERLNLAVGSGPYYSALGFHRPVDVIFCRNVLMYFSPERRRNIIGRLYSSLNNDGWLIVSPSEAADVMQEGLVAVTTKGGTVYQKKGLENKNNSFFSLLPKKSAANDRLGKADQRPMKLFRSASGMPQNAEPQSNVAASLKKGVAAPAVGQGQIAMSPCEQVRQKVLSLLQQGHYQECAELAADFFKQRENLKTPNAASLLYLLVKAYANLGNHDASLHWAREALAVDKLNSDLYYLLAGIYNEKGMFSEALKVLNQVIFLEPDCAMAYFSMATIFRAQGRADEAMTRYAALRKLLAGVHSDDILPHSEGLTAGRLRQTVETLMETV